MTEPAKVFGSHDHGACMASGLKLAEEICLHRGLRFTPVRRRVLEILLEAHNAIGAYDVLARLTAEGLGSQPPVVYRALSFLVEHGFAHRIEGASAFIACVQSDTNHQPVFMICTKCARVAEADSSAALNVLAGSAKALGFTMETSVLEIKGFCETCREAGS